jgi:hypothetical protein
MHTQTYIETIPKIPKWGGAATVHHGGSVTHTHQNGIWSFKLFQNQNYSEYDIKHCILITFIFYNRAVVKQDHYLIHVK